MKFRLLFCILALTSSAYATPTTIQPNESTSEDAFVYQFLPTSNFDSSGSFSSFGVLLTSGQTGIGHDTRSFLQFDLTGVTLNPGETATLNLYVDSTSVAGFGTDPSPSAPLTTDIFPNTSAWDESTVTWNAEPSVGSLAASQTISAVNQWVSFDITSLVQQWLNTPSTNFGVGIFQHAVVGGGSVVAVYDSSAATNKPYLQIVPEPELAGFLAISTVFGLVRRRLRCD